VTPVVKKPIPPTVRHSTGGPTTTQNRNAIPKPRLSAPLSSSVQQTRKPNPKPSSSSSTNPASISLLNKEPPQKRQKIPEKK